MAIIDSADTGYWAAGTTWSGGNPPGNNDLGRINYPHTVTVAAAAQARGFILNGGHLILNANFTVTDTIDAYIQIKANLTSSFTSNGTAAAPRIIQSASTSPTHPWTVTVDDVTGFDSRVLTFDFVEMRGNLWYLGNDGYYLNFNDRTIPPGAWITSITPLSRDPIIIEHPIDGRARSRIYQRGSHAGTVTISGYVPWSDWSQMKIGSLQDSGQRMSLFTRYVHLPQCRFDDRPRFSPRRGSPYIDFTITLIEDR